jgi:tripartite-type tricarboxylate transporter receptor subunit TctC
MPALPESARAFTRRVPASRSSELSDRLPLHLIAVTLAALLLTGCAKQPADVSKYPNRSLNLVVPWAPGGGTDRVARFVADALHRRLGQPVIVINRTGGSGAVGHSAGALAAADGHTLIMATFELSTMHWMGISKLTWNDFLPVAQLNGDAAAILVQRDAPWKNLRDLLETIRQQPARIKMSGTSTGGAWDLARSGLLLAAGIAPSTVIWAPTQGSAPALVELLGGHVDVVCCSVPEAVSQLDGGQVRLLAVLGPGRLADFPDYPTAREQGIAYDAVGWRGILLPKNTPAEIAKFLGARLTEIAASEEFQQFMKKNGFAVVVRGPGEFAEFLRAEDAKWGDVIKSAGYETLGKNHDPGPKAMPLLLVALLVLCLALETARSRKALLRFFACLGTMNRGATVARASRPCAELTGETPAPLPAASWKNRQSRRDQEGEASGPKSEIRNPKSGVEPRRLSPATADLASGPSSLSIDALFLLGALMLYVAAMPWIGFAPSTAVFTFVAMWRLGTRWWLAAIGSAVIVLTIHLLFVLLFKVQLP